MMWPCKNMRHSGGKTVPLIIGAGGEFVDAVAEMNNLKRVDPVALGAESSTPLFRKPNGRPFKVEEIVSLRDWVEKLMRAVGEEPSQFGAHSIRIGGPSARAAAARTTHSAGRPAAGAQRATAAAQREARCGGAQAKAPMRSTDAVGAREAKPRRRRALAATRCSAAHGSVRGTGT